MNPVELNDVNGLWVTLSTVRGFCSGIVAPSTITRPIAECVFTGRSRIEGNWSVKYIPSDENPMFDEAFVFPKVKDLARSLFARLFAAYEEKLLEYYHTQMMQEDREQIRPYYDGVQFLRRLYGKWIRAKDWDVIFPDENSTANNIPEVLIELQKRVNIAQPGWTVFLNPQEEDLLEELKLTAEAEWYRKKQELEKQDHKIREA